jgi:hypothetical protein
MRIIAEANRLKGTKRAETRFWFDGVPVDRPLRITELNVWNRSLGQILNLVKDEMKAPKKSRRKL